MGQKVNSNSFNLNRKNLNNFFHSIDSVTNYSYILKDIYFLQFLFKYFFEQHNFFVKECFIIFSSVKYKIYIYISFFSNLNLVQHQKYLKKNNVNLKFISFFNFFLNTYSFAGYKKVYIFKNLNLNFKKFKLNKYFHKVFRLYKTEPYFIMAQQLIFLIQKTDNGVNLLINFVSKFLTTYHRQKRSLNKFIHFLNLFLNFLYKFKIVLGIRIQLKGRLRGTPRSKKYVFQQGQVPTQTITSSIKYQYKQIYTRYGTVGLKIWIYQH